MALKIRMARGGSKKRPVYRVVVTDSRNARDGKFIEKIGTHNPLLANDHPERFTINEERAKYWISVGAQTSERVNKYLAKLGVEKAQARFEKTKKSQPKKKAQERLAANLEKQKAAEQAAVDAAEAAQKVKEEEAAVVVEAVETAEAPVVEAQSEAENSAEPKVETEEKPSEESETPS
ncbi:30S ribosomal protein S16 [Alphaproteobacteria bacterium]|jgi:small subunit ribosomal protein S16|nr:30S ribosomal protein S16 [Alphaproteobacteria bacterium]